jgi:AmiR/NasT family two-component response regulator
LQRELPSIDSQAKQKMARERILVVEDERLVAEDLRDMLGTAGYEVVGVAGKGEKAVEQAGKLLPDLVLMDVHLGGGMDGVTAAEIIGERHGTPVVYLTAYSNDKTLDRARNTAAFGFVLKPFHEKAVIAAVEIALGRHGREKLRDQSENFLRKGFMSLPVGVIMADSGENVVFANGLARIHIGRSLDADKKVPLAAVFSRATNDLPDNGEATERLGQVTEMSGRPLEVAYFEEPLVSNEGEPLGSIIVYQDAAHPVIPGKLGNVMREFMKSVGDQPLSPAQFITVCAWSKKIKVGDDRWVPFEEFLMHYLGLQVTHGMSPEAAQSWTRGGS